MEKITEELEQVAALLAGETTLALATTDKDCGAHATPLFYLADAAMTLYWISSPQTRHSMQALRQVRAATTIYRSASSWEEIRGVQMRGLIKIVTQAERRAALLKRYCERFKLGGVFSLAIRQGTMYAFEPMWIRYIDNSVRFAYKFELERESEGWRKAQ